MSLTKGLEAGTGEAGGSWLISNLFLLLFVGFIYLFIFRQGLTALLWLA